MKKIISTLLFFSLLLTSFSVQAETEINLDKEVEASDLNVNNSKLLPGHPFYFLKDWGRNISLLFAFDSVKKANLESQFANEKLIELKRMTELGMNKDSIEKGVEDYKKRIKKVEKLTKKIEKNQENNQKINEFSEQFTKEQILHYKVLQKIENKVPKEIVEKIKEVKEKNLDNFQKVLTRFEGSDKVVDKIDKILTKSEGGQFKEIKEIEVLKTLKNKVPEQIKEKIEEQTEKRIQTLKGKLEEASSEDQEKFQEYIQNNNNARIYLDIIDNLKGRSLSDNLKTIIEKVREINLEKIREQTQDVNSSEVQEGINLNKNLLEQIKTFVLQKGLEKNETPEIYEYIQNAEIDLSKAQEYIQNGNYIEAFSEVQSSESLSKNATEILKKIGGFKIESGEDGENKIICTDQEVPVCSKDAVTYRNLCEAQKVNAKIAYRGQCQKDLECAKQGEKVNRNPFLGPTNQECCEGLEEFRISKSYSVCEASGKDFECEEDSDCPLSKTNQESKCEEGKCIIPENEKDIICIQVITSAEGPNGECEEFSSPCDVPANWTQVNSCEGSGIKLKDSEKQQEIENQNQLREKGIIEMQEQIQESIENILNK